MGRIGVFMSVIGENTRLQLAVLLWPPVIPPPPCLSWAGPIGKEQVFLLEKGYVILPHSKEQEGKGWKSRGEPWH